MTGDIGYAAFISYAHADEAVAARLHKALETYPIPKNLGTAQRGDLFPIFRDTAELTAHHSLPEKIQEAVTRSRFLIVLCSSAAKKSHWVNEEIRLFRKIHGEGAILCVLCEGTPQTSFPPALLDGGREPLAANLGEGREGFKLGTSQLAASMLDVGLDALLQRDHQRRRRRLQVVTGTALLFSTAMGVTAFTAIEARNEAQLSRTQAEGLVEYMITGLKDKLEPVGRLDILDSVGDRAVEYYDAQDISKSSDESLSRQARARHILGQVAIEANRQEDAIREIEAAAQLTQEVLNRNPEDADAIFAHAQSEFWVGKLFRKNRDFDGLLKHWTRYKELGLQLYDKDPNNFNWVMEAGYGENNLGNIAMGHKDYETAYQQFNAAIDFFNQALRLEPNSQKPLSSLANAYAGASRSALNVADKATAINYRRKQIEIYDQILRDAPNNYKIIYRRTNASAGQIKDGLIEIGSDEYLKTVKEIHDAFELLTNYDPQNKMWQAEYAYFKNIDLDTDLRADLENE